MRPIAGNPGPHDWLVFDPIEVLDEFDFPRIFTCKDISGDIYLAYNCGYDRNGLRFLVVPSEDSLVLRLVEGKVNLRDALSNKRAWIFDLNKKWEPVSAMCVDVDKLPFDMLPRPGTMLYSWLDPIIVQNQRRPSTSDIVKIVEWPRAAGKMVEVLVHG